MHFFLKHYIQISKIKIVSEYKLEITKCNKIAKKSIQILLTYLKGIWYIFFKTLFPTFSSKKEL